MSNEPRIMLLPSPPSSGSVGSISKSLGIAKVLQKRGCVVGFIVGGRLAELVRSYGYLVYDYPIPVTSGAAGSIRSAADFIEWTGMADPDFIRQAVEAEMEAIRNFRPNAIFAECRPSSSISVPASGIPSLMIASWPAHPLFPANIKYPGSKKSIEAFNMILEEYGLEEINNLAELLFSRADVKMAPTLRELEPELAALKEFNFAGYILDLDDIHNEKLEWHQNWADKPLIFIYLSVSAIPPTIYLDMVRKIFDNQPYRVACLCGFHYNLKELPANTDNIYFDWFIPAASIMKETSLVIFHGGQDTMLTAILHGLPTITVPGQHFERDYNSTQLQKLGLSYKMPVHAFRPSRVLQIVKEALSQDKIELHKEYMSKLQALNGTERCCTALIELVQKNDKGAITDEAVYFI